MEAGTQEATAASQLTEQQEEELFRHVHDIAIDVGVELDRKQMTVRKVLGLQVGSVIKMKRSAGENVDLQLNGVAVGNGEIVVIEDMMGLRITDLGFATEMPDRD